MNLLDLCALTAAGYADEGTLLDTFEWERTIALLRASSENMLWAHA